MNAMVSFRANGTGRYSPTPAERAEAIERVWSSTLVRLKGAQASAEPSAKGNVAKSVAKSASSASSSSVSGAGYGELDRDAFLNLLVMQMQYQDPMSPISNEDMIANLAQFSALEQMTNLNTSFELLAGSLAGRQLVDASSLIGRQVSGLDAEGGLVEGVVDRVYAESGTLYVGIGDQTAPVEYLRQIQLGPAAGDAAATEDSK